MRNDTWSSLQVLSGRFVNRMVVSMQTAAAAADLSMGPQHCAKASLSSMCSQRVRSCSHVVISMPCRPELHSLVARSSDATKTHFGSETVLPSANVKLLPHLIAYLPLGREPCIVFSHTISLPGATRGSVSVSRSWSCIRASARPEVPRSLPQSRILRFVRMARSPEKSPEVLVSFASAISKVSKVSKLSKNPK